MLFIYLIFNTILIFISYHFFKRKFNPVSVYSIIWTLMLIGFEIKLFYYNDLNFITWLVIISFQLSYTIGCFVGATINNSNKNTSFGLKINDKNHDDTSKKLKQIIILLSLVSAFSIIPNLINLYKQYGSNILASSALIYHDRLTGNRGFELIPYLGSLSHVAVILSGVFFIRYGYKFFLIIPFILLILNILPTGGRMDLLYGILYLLIPILLHKKRLKKTFRFKHKLIVSIIGGVCLFILATISNVRTINKTHPSYMSPLMSKLFNKSPVFASIYTYTTAPVGVLNKYLEEPEINFGSNTFGFFYSILNKLGCNIEYERYQEFLPIPMNVNVGTYIREIIQDFSYISILLVLVLGIVFGKQFKASQTHNSVLVSYSLVLLFITVIMSFYMFTYREPVFWIISISGLFVCLYIDSPIRIRMIKTKLKICL